MKPAKRTVPAIDGADLTPKFPPPRPVSRTEPSSASPTTRPPRRPNGASLPFGASGHCTLCVFTVSAKASTMGRAGVMVVNGIAAHMRDAHPSGPTSSATAERPQQATGAGS